MFEKLKINYFNFIEQDDNRLMDDDYIVMVNQAEYEKLKKESLQLNQLKKICQQKDTELQKIHNECVLYLTQKQLQAKKIKSLNDIIFDLMNYLLKIDQQIQNKKQQCLKISKQKDYLIQTIKKQQIQLISLKQSLISSKNEGEQLKKLLLDLKTSIKQTHDNIKQKSKEDLILINQQSQNNIYDQRNLLFTISRIIDERSQKAIEAEQSKKKITKLEKQIQQYQIQLIKQKNIIKNYQSLEKEMQVYQTQIQHLQQQKNYLANELQSKYKALDSMTQLIKQYEKADEEKEKEDGIKTIVQQAVVLFKNLQKKLKFLAIDSEEERYNHLQSAKVHLINEINRKVVFEKLQKKHKK